MTQGSPSRVTLAPGLVYVPDYLDRASQTRVLDDLRRIIAAAPLIQPVMPKSGVPYSVRMTNCGSRGWISDLDGYRYVPDHPGTGTPWPAMPPAILAAWRELAGYPQPPEACLVNYYAPTARMGLHQDRDEESFVAPVLSLSLGDTCVFRYGGTQRRAPTRSVRLASGDALILGGASRLAFHGVDRIVPGSSTLIAEGGRFNLTIRCVTAEPSND